MNNTQNESGETFRITGNWNAQSRQLKKIFTQLTSTDLRFKSGNEEELLSRLESKLISFIKSVRR